MRTLAVFVAVFGLALAQYRPQSGGSDAAAEIVKAASDVNPDGSYQWNYETSNGIQAQEQGQLTGNQQEPAIAAQGSFQYTAPDGTPIQTSYVADENGFQPQGAHLPVPPPIPEAILRAIAWNEAHPEPEQRPQQGRF